MATRENYSLSSVVIRNVIIMVLFYGILTFDKTVQMQSVWSPFAVVCSFLRPPVLRPTLDLSEFNVNVMTRNNGAHQRSPYDPGIQK